MIYSILLCPFVCISSINEASESIGSCSSAALEACARRMELEPAGEDGAGSPLVRTHTDRTAARSDDLDGLSVKLESIVVKVLIMRRVKAVRFQFSVEVNACCMFLFLYDK